MGIFRDVLDIVRDLRTIGSVEDFFSKKKYSSISKRSLEGTLQFPVIVSRSMDIDTLQIISKALERQFASFVQISLTMDPSLNLEKEKDIIGYLRKFHQNTGVKTDTFDTMHSLGEIFENFSTGIMTDENESMYLAGVICEGSTGNVVISNKEQLDDLGRYVRTEILNEMFKPKQDVYKFPNQNLNDYFNQSMQPVTEAPSADDIVNARAELSRARLRDVDPYKYALDNEKLDIERRKISEMERQNEISRKLAEDKLAMEREKNKLSSSSIKDKDFTYVPSNILKDNDVRKANELVPTTLHIRVNVFDGEKKNQGFFDFIIGVKTTMHPVPSDEMITNVVGACRNNNKIFNFIRWTTGEINFFKDFLFNIKEIKDDVFNRSAGASPWWITLKRRRALAKMKRLTFMPNQLLPNTTIVISMDEVEYIKSEYGFDLMNPAFVDKIMKEYFLLSFVVVDNSTQIAHFMFDGQTSYQSITFSALEKENTNKADLKEVLKILNRSNIV